LRRVRIPEFDAAPSAAATAPIKGMTGQTTAAGIIFTHASKAIENEEIMPASWSWSTRPHRSLDDYIHGSSLGLSGGEWRFDATMSLSVLTT